MIIAAIIVGGVWFAVYRFSVRPDYVKYKEWRKKHPFAQKQNYKP